MTRIFHAVDIGNFTTLSMTTGVTSQPVVKKSILARVLPGSDLVDPGAHSVIVESEDYGIVHFGDRASEYGPMSAGLISLNKLSPEYFIPSILSTLGPIGDVTVYDVTLQWSLPNPRAKRGDSTVGEYLKSILDGRFKYKFTDHRGTFNMDVKIRPEDPRPEGYDALIQARQDGFLHQGNVLGVDIGGGTMDIIVAGPRGNILKRHSYDGRGSDLAGAKAIAGVIRDLPIMTERLGGPPQLEVLMESFCDGPNQYRYPADNGQWIDYSDQLKSVSKFFFDKIGEELNNNFKSVQPISGCMIFGGGAHIFRGRLSSHIYVPERPELSNILALHQLNQTSSVMAAK